MDMIRIWHELDIKEIDDHIIIVDDLHGFCPACKTTGIKFGEMDKCPGCKREFKYAATRESGSAGAKIITKIIKNSPQLTIVEYSDYKHHTDKNKAASLFGNL